MDKYDCPHCGQDLRLPADAPERLRALTRIARLARHEHAAATREIGNEDHQHCAMCHALASLEKVRKLARIARSRR